MTAPPPGLPITVVAGHGPVAAALASARTSWPTTPTLTWWEVARPVLVLGSAQPWSVVDHDAAARAGVEVCRRASGGGAVLLAPGDTVWGDLVLPPDDPRWDDDIVRAAAWVGDAWSRALRSLLGDEVAIERHAGGLVRTAWSELVCFAGVGPGEVLVAGRKVVGISQRRTRHGARFQMAVVRRWDPVGILDLLVLAPDARARAEAELREVAAGVAVTVPALTSAFSAALG